MYHLFEFLSQEIEISVESMKTEIDKLSGVVLDNMNRIEQNYLKMMKKKEKKIKKIVRILKKSKNVFIRFDRVNQSLDLKFIQNNLEMPSNLLIGSLHGLDIDHAIYMDDIKNSDVQSIKLKFNPYDLCNCFNDYLAITDYLNHKVYLFNKKFQQIKSISCVDNEYFNSPRGICTDSVSKIYLCDTLNQRVLIVDKEFSELKQIIKNLVHINEPQSICVDGGNLFILDARMKTIVNLNSNGDYIKKFCLANDLNLVKNPLCMKLVDSCKVAININREKLLICDLNGDTDHVIEFEYEIGALFYSNGFLLVHQYNGMLICYKKNENQNWLFEYERMIPFNGGTWSATDFNKHLVFTVCNRNIFFI